MTVVDMVRMSCELMAFNSLYSKLRGIKFHLGFISSRKQAISLMLLGVSSSKFSNDFQFINCLNLTSVYTASYPGC